MTWRWSIPTRSTRSPLRHDGFAFVDYDANKALMNRGHPARFGADRTAVGSEIMAVLSTSATENHDSFFWSGSSYAMGHPRVHG